MSMFDDVLGFGRSSVMESMTGGFEPEVEETTLESVSALDESVDPMDFILQVAYENEMNMKNLDMAIMAEEYMLLRESGQEMVYEGSAITSIIDKFKAGVKWLWENIQKFFKTVMKKIDDTLKLDQRFLDKYEKKAAGKTAMVNGIAGVDVNNISKVGQTIIASISDLSGMVFDDLQNDKTTKYDDVQTLIKEILGEATARDADTATAVMKAMLKGTKSDKKEQQFKADEAIKLFKESKAAKAELKSFYNENKKTINAQIKAAKKMEAAAKRFKVVPTETSKAIHGTVKVLNKLGSLMTLTNRTFVKLINMARAQYKAIIVAAAAKATSENTNESVSIIDSIEFGMTF